MATETTHQHGNHPNVTSISLDMVFAKLCSAVALCRFWHLQHWKLWIEYCRSAKALLNWASEHKHLRTSAEEYEKIVSEQNLQHENIGEHLQKSHCKRLYTHLYTMQKCRYSYYTQPTRPPTPTQQWRRVQCTRYRRYREQYKIQQIPTLLHPTPRPHHPPYPQHRQQDARTLGTRFTRIVSVTTA